VSERASTSAGTAWLRLAFVCGLLPLVAGIGIFATWTVTRAPLLEFLALLDIALGSILAIVGLIATSMYAARASKAGVRGWRSRVLAAGAIILGNFPAAIAAVAAASHMISAYAVAVDNGSPDALEHLAFESAQGHYPFGTIPAGSRVERIFRFEGEGAVTYSARHKGRPVAGTLDGYVSGTGGAKTIRVQSDGRIEVLEGAE